MAPSRGSAALTEAINQDRTLRRRIVGELDVSEQAVRNWEVGDYAPKYRYRRAIESITGIAIDAWDEVAPSAAALPATGTEGG